jgi:DNA processing protein
MNINTLSLHCFNTFSQIGPKSLSAIQKIGAEKLWREGVLADFKKIFSPRAKFDWYTEFESLDKDNFLIQEEKYLQSEGIHLIAFGDIDYPERLAQIAVPPIVLYVKGDITGIDNALAIVGTRKYTNYGAHITEKMSKELSELGLPIISGLALGIDSIAHRGCLDGKSKTIAVLGGGISSRALYPQSNQRLAQAIIAGGGALVSEFPPLSKPRRENFILRNRIVSGLSRGILVIEAPIKSGTMTTVQYALEQNRDVFAIPGNIDVKNSEGTNALIKQGAYLVTEIQDILNIFDIEAIIPSFALSEFSPEQQSIIQYLIQEPMAIEVLSEKTSQEIMDLMAILSIMELSGIIRQGEQGEYTLIMNIE